MYSVVLYISFSGMSIYYLIKIFVFDIEVPATTNVLVSAISASVTALVIMLRLFFYLRVWVIPLQ